MPALKIHPTPNPNSLKFTHADRAFIPSGLASFRSAREAAGHPLGARLFAVPGVADVLVLPQFLTITKQPQADWDALLPAVEAAIEAYFAEVQG